MHAIRFDAYHVLPDSPQMQRDFLQVLTALAARSDHPMAQDILRVAKANSILPVGVSGYQEFLHRGVGGLIQLPNEARPRPVLVGTREFVAESGLQVPAILEVTARKWENEPDAFIALGGWDGWVRGVLKFVQS